MDKRNIVHRFLDWWKDAPLYKSVWFVPVVIFLYVIAIIKNIVIGEK